MTTETQGTVFDRTGPVLFIALVNLLPLVGVLWLGWNLSELLFIYWLESFIVGASNLVLIAASNGPGRIQIGRMLFFGLHYGGFWLAHGLFLFIVLIPAISQAGGENMETVNGMSTVLWGLALSYAVATILRLLRTPREERLSPTAQMFAPYGRVFIMHIVILGGAWLAAKHASATPVLLLFVGLKLAFDLATHAIGRRLYRPSD